MTSAPAAPPRRLVLLAVVVAVVHAWLLQHVLAPSQRLSAPLPPVFRTRTVALPSPPAIVAERAPVEAASPPPAPRPRPPRLPSAAAEAPAPPIGPPAVSSDAGRADAGAAMGSGEIAAAPEAAAATPAASSPSAATFAILAPRRLRYDVQVETKGIHLSGQAELQWRHDGRDYEARLEVSSPLLPSRVQRSQGRITPEGLAPSYFADRSRNEQATHFDREQGRIVFSNNRPQAAWAVGVQDRLSLMLQLAAMVAGRPDRFRTGTQIEVPTASTREAETWIFDIAGEEDLVLPGGNVRALKLQRLPRREYDVKVELWLAPRMDYAPVRLRLTNPNGDAADHRWSSTDRG